MGLSPAIPLVSYIKIVLASLGIYSNAVDQIGYKWPGQNYSGLNDAEKGKEDPLIAKMRTDGVLDEVCAEWGIEFNPSIPILPEGTNSEPNSRRRHWEQYEQEGEFRKAITTIWLDYHMRQVTWTSLKSDAYYQHYNPSVDREDDSDEDEDYEDEDHEDED